MHIEDGRLYDMGRPCKIMLSVWVMEGVGVAGDGYLVHPTPNSRSGFNINING